MPRILTCSFMCCPVVEGRGHCNLGRDGPQLSPDVICYANGAPKFIAQGGLATRFEFQPTPVDFGHYYYHNVLLIVLGEFEYLLLSAAARLGDDAYGVPIRQEIEQATGRRCSTGALYTTLDRLESKGLLRSWMGDATPQRGGRPKRMVRVTAKGSREAAAFYKAVTRVSRGVSWEAASAGGES